MRKKILSLWFVLLSHPAFSEGDISGFTKLHSLTYRFHASDDIYRDIYQINRLTYSNDFFSDMFFEASCELTFVKLNHSYNFDIDRPYRIGDPKHIAWKNDPSDIFLLQNPDRFSLTWNFARAAVTVGRQQIAFGSGRTVNPTDIFTPLRYSVIDTEVRQGVDAIRFRQQLGDMGQSDFGLILGKDADEKESGVYLLTRLILGDFEVQPVVTGFKQAVLVGLDMTTTGLGASIWSESALVKPSGEEPYLRSVIGAERQIHQSAVMFVEYHYNGPGKRRSEVKQKFAFEEGGVFLSGRHYIDIGSSLQLSSLYQLTGSIKHNMEDHSYFLSGILEWNAMEDIYLNAGLFYGAGKSETEFGQEAKTLFARARYYF